MGRIWGKIKRGFRAIGRGVKKAIGFYDKHKDKIATVADAVGGKAGAAVKTGMGYADKARDVGRKLGY
jgi:hypothetical protein